MDPVTLVAAAMGVLVLSAVAGAGVHHSMLARKQSYLRGVEEALDAQRFTVERVEQRHTGRDGVTEVVLTAALVARDERIHVHLAPTWRGASATIVVRGVKAASNATFTVERENAVTRVVGRGSMADIRIGDALFDERHRIYGWPKDRARAIVGAQKVKNAIESMFSFDDVTGAALVALRDGGVVRVTLDLDKGRIGAVRPVADLALTCAEAPVEAPPEGAAGVEGGAPVGVPGIPPRRT
jgi:hypothetical protein